MPRKTLAKFISDKLIEANWPGITINEDKQLVECQKGEILTLLRREYHLKFFWYSLENKEYNLREKYREIVFLAILREKS